MSTEEEIVARLRAMGMAPIDVKLAEDVRQQAVQALTRPVSARTFELPQWADRIVDVALVCACAGQLWWSGIAAKAAVHADVQLAVRNGIYSIEPWGQWQLDQRIVLFAPPEKNRKCPAPST
jgi:hypothetical protein